MMPKLLSGTQATGPRPEILIDFFAWQKIIAYATLCPHEISGIGTVEQRGNVFVVTSAFILPQFTFDDGSFVEFEPGALNQLIEKYLEQNKNPAKLKFQWHSHAWSKVFFSGIDLDTIESYMSDLMISLVVNKYGEYRLRLDVFRPVQLSLQMPMRIQIKSPKRPNMRWCQRDIDKKVRIVAAPKPMPPIDTSAGNGVHGGHGDFEGGRMMNRTGLRQEW